MTEENKTPPGGGSAHTDEENTGGPHPHGAGGGEASGDRERRREFEERFDRMADKFSRVMGDAVRRMEEAFEKGKNNVQRDLDDSTRSKRLSGSPRMGLILVGLGVVWLLYSLGVFRQPIFPILVIVVGIYFMIRSRQGGGDRVD